MSDEIKKLLPHREPFLFVDSVDVNEDGTYTGYRKFTEDDFFFKGHFPDYPVVPGVILVETMAQCGGAGIGKAGLIPPGQIFFFATAEKVKFRQQVRPGDTVRVEVENMRVSKAMIKQTGKAYVGDDVAAEATWLCLLGSADNMK
ncbi:MAG: 3-hydroxyacyl-ACP dehydratase FabZ [Spirochaetales bacterium]|uniref:3-hydroxyacyl-[acyl-carrier-protein] dehydratase n=1 Tax=Candidatus Thalassospirochaeta sargassi TaxID=3119039 RepID=A0AAJ1MJD3_9SPIO|nr:3-hydroxyacyl-ACP dehydratase FabZ [Spirochaetales bacterium]